MPGVKGKAAGKVGRPPLKAGERSVHLGVRLTETEHRLLLAEVEARNVRAEAEGLGQVTPASVARRLIVSGLMKPAVVERVAHVTEPEHEDEHEGALPNGHPGSDETRVREPIHRKRPVVERSEVPTPVAVEGPPIVSEGPAAATNGPPVDAPPVVEGEPENDDLADMAAMLEGTPL